jgi:hypothetical protein
MQKPIVAARDQTPMIYAKGEDRMFPVGQICADTCTAFARRNSVLLEDATVLSSLLCHEHLLRRSSPLFLTFTCSNHRLNIELRLLLWLNVVKPDEAGLPAADLVGGVLGEDEGNQVTEEVEVEHIEEVEEAAETIFVETFGPGTAALA